MKSSLKTITFAVAAATCLAVGTVAAAQRCYDFTAPAVGTVFSVGSTLTLNAADIEFEAFQRADLTSAFGNAEVVMSNEAGGTPMKELDMRNINMHFTFHQDADGVRFFYGDWASDSAGANVNFAVNGDFRNVATISALNGAVVGGANIAVSFVNGVGFERGEVEITPLAGKVITDFLVGGQEFFLDDVCHHW